MQAFAVTNHGPEVTDGVHPYHFQNLGAVPRYINEVAVLRGIECNILNRDAEIDFDERWLNHLEIVIASIHQSEYRPLTEQEHTETLLKVIGNPVVNIMGHMGREPMPFDIERVVKAAKKHGKLVEINSSSLNWGGRITSRCREIALMCKKHKAPVVVNSDSHICYSVGNVENAIALLESIDFDESLVMNTDLEKIKNYLNINF